MNLIDTSAWMVYLADDTEADFFASAIEDTPQCYVCAHSVFEVYHRIRLEQGESLALQAAALMRQCKVISLDAELSMEAAELAARDNLRFPAAVVLHAARRQNALLWTTHPSLSGYADVRMPNTSTADL